MNTDENVPASITKFHNSLSVAMTFAGTGSSMCVTVSVVPVGRKGALFEKYGLAVAPSAQCFEVATTTVGTVTVIGSWAFSGIAVSPAFWRINLVQYDADCFQMFDTASLPRLVTLYGS